MDGGNFILFIKGVFISSLDEYVEEDTMESEYTFNEIPTKFISIEKWIDKTDILCGHCGIKHDYPPAFIPFHINYNGPKYEITIIKLLFCSFPCAATYIKENYIGAEYEKMMDMLKIACKCLTGILVDNIPFAPKREAIECYGGRTAKYTVDGFRKVVNQFMPRNKYLI